MRRFRPGIAELREHLVSPDFTSACLIAAAGRAAPSAELSLSDFPHQKRELSLLRDYLAECLRRHRPGVNVFLHGPPGTGKTPYKDRLDLPATVFGQKLLPFKLGGCCNGEDARALEFRKGLKIRGF